jgi:hypothetical protein
MKKKKTKRPGKTRAKSSVRKKPPAARRSQLRAAAVAYFEGLAEKDMSAVPYAEDVILHAPLAPGGAANPIHGKDAVLQFFSAILQALGEVKVLEHFTNEKMTRICTEARVGVTNPSAILRVTDCFTVDSRGRITMQENYYDPRPALPA